MMKNVGKKGFKRSQFQPYPCRMETEETWMGGGGKKKLGEGIEGEEGEETVVGM